MDEQKHEVDQGGDGVAGGGRWQGPIRFCRPAGIGLSSRVALADRAAPARSGTIDAPSLTVPVRFAGSLDERKSVATRLTERPNTPALRPTDPIFLSVGSHLQLDRRHLRDALGTEQGEDLAMPASYQGVCGNRWLWRGIGRASEEQKAAYYQLDGDHQ